MIGRQKSAAPKQKMTAKQLGDYGEQIAANYLKARNYQILALKYRAVCGEIDIIARDRGTLVFAEVKSRRCQAFGTPAQSVDNRKRHKIIRAAQSYLNETGRYNEFCRFDVIEIYVTDEDKYEINQIENAFELC